VASTHQKQFPARRVFPIIKLPSCQRHMFLTSYQMPNKKPTTTPKMKITAPMRTVMRKSFAELAYSA
jgi:methionine synthase II (cobalamin-independent)